MNMLRLGILALFVLTVILFAAVKIKDAMTDDTPPVIHAAADLLEVSVTDGEDKLLQGMTATDRQDGDLTDKLMVAGISQLITEDTAKVTYVVFDSDGNMHSYVRKIRYTDYRRPHFRLTAPLVCEPGQSTTLTDKLFASDVIDGDLSESIRVTAYHVNWEAEGQYTITVSATNSMGDTATVTLPLTVERADVTRPTVTLNEYLIYLSKGDTFDPTAYLVAATSDGVTPLGLAEVTVRHDVDTAKDGTYSVTYTYTAANGKTGTATLTVVVG